MIKRAVLARELGVPIVMLGVFKIEWLDAQPYLLSHANN